MKTHFSKWYIFVILLFTPNILNAREYINDSQCIYSIDVANLTADVVNFCGEETNITIPSSFTYLGDVYTVIALRHEDFHREYNSKYYFVDYNKIRSRILEITLPQTVTEISNDAFVEMVRLRSLIFNGNIHLGKYRGLSLSDNKRLESITFLGLPEYTWDECVFCKETQIKHFKIQEDPALFIQMTDSILIAECPSLKSINYPSTKDILAYYSRLKDTLSFYNNKLQNNPYYFVSDRNKFQINAHINPTTLEQSHVLISYNEALSDIRKQYYNLSEHIADSCRKYQPDTFISVYCEQYPEFKVKVDSLYARYKCEITFKHLVFQLIDNISIPQDWQDCREKLYQLYSNLFYSRDEFLTRYYNSESFFQFSSEIDERKELVNHVMENQNINLKGCVDKNRWLYEYLTHICKKKSISHELVINLNNKMKKEYEKNGEYFSNAADFYDAYLSSDYDAILKDNKKRK